ncbi:MAG: hypothetical protein KDJ14_04005 [Xanthomonadales bacterium]|nr:hypothetical protein [Xanthomonadales bacterium]
MSRQERLKLPWNAALRHQLAAWLLVLLALMGSVGCSRTPDEQALRDAFDAMLAAAEARKPDDFMEHVADDFASGKGVDRQQLHRILIVQFMRNQSVSVTTSPLEITVDGKRAEMAFKIFVTGSSGGWIPERAEGYSIHTLWRFEDGDWLVEFADWD